MARVLLFVATFVTMEVEFGKVNEIEDAFNFGNFGNGIFKIESLTFIFGWITKY